jgi:hypothetical protein
MDLKRIRSVQIGFTFTFILTMLLVFNFVRLIVTDPNNEQYQTRQIVFMGSEAIGLILAVLVWVFSFLLRFPSQSLKLGYRWTVTVLFACSTVLPIVVSRPPENMEHTIYILPAFDSVVSLIGLVLATWGLRVDKVNP